MEWEHHVGGSSTYFISHNYLYGWVFVTEVVGDLLFFGSPCNSLFKQVSYKISNL